MPDPGGWVGALAPTRPGVGGPGRLAPLGGALKGGAYFVMIPRGPLALHTLALLLVGSVTWRWALTLQTRAPELYPGGARHRRRALRVLPLPRRLPGRSPR